MGWGLGLGLGAGAMLGFPLQPGEGMADKMGGEGDLATARAQDLTSKKSSKRPPKHNSMLERRESHSNGVGMLERRRHARAR